MSMTIDRISSQKTSKNEEIEALQEQYRAEQLQQENALSQVFRLLNTLSNIMQESKRDFLDVVRSDLKSYREESNDLSAERIFQGWSVASLTLAGTTCLGASALISEISELSPLALDFIDSLGGADNVKTLFQTSSQFSEGMKPALNVLSESRITNKETNRQFLQLAYQRGQQAADQGNATIDKLVSAALRLYETDARSKG